MREGADYSDKDIPGVELPGPGLRPIVDKENKGRVKSLASRLRNRSREEKTGSKEN